MATLKSADLALIEAARTIIKKRFRQGYHHVGAALRTKSGKIFTGVHLEAYVGRVAVCAEAIAIGTAASLSGNVDVDTIVAVQRHGRIVSPCGLCREMISDFSPSAKVIVPGKTGPELMTIKQLLPRKYRK